MRLETEEVLKNSHKTRSRIVDWLISNSGSVNDIVNKSSQLINDVDPLFYEEAIEQRNIEIRRLVQDEISRSIGLTPEDFNSTISKEEFDTYLEEVMNEK